MEVLRSAIYPRHLTLMSLGVLMPLGDMPSCRHPFMYAQEATGLPLLLEIERGWAPYYYCSSWGCEQTGTGHWIKQHGDIMISRISQVPLSRNPHREDALDLLRFRDQGKKRDLSWLSGKMWGVEVIPKGL